MKDLCILSAGAVSSVGLSLPATAAAIRAAVDNFQETQFIGPKAEPLLGARVDLCLAEEADGSLVVGLARLIRMVSLVVEECLANHPKGESTALLMVLPHDERPMDIKGLAKACEAACVDHLGQPSTDTLYFTSGSTGCVNALKEASRLLEKGTIRRVLMVGVDTWLTTPSIQQALLQNRLLTSEKSDGIIPGEGAAAILLGPSVSLNGIKLAIRGIGSAEESATFFSEEPCTGKGLAAAMAGALNEAGFPPHQIHFRIALTGGEEYFFSEAAHAWSRMLRQPQPLGNQLLFPTSCVGDVGAAAGLLAMAYAWHLHRINRLPGPNTLVYLSSTHKQRGAIAASTA